MKKTVYSILLISTLFGQSKVGTAAAAFLGIPVGPRSVAMGGAMTSLVTDASIICWNPGSISRLNTSQAQFVKSDWLVDTDINFVASVIDISRSGSFGIYFSQLDYGKIEITELSDQDGTGLYYTSSDIVTGIAYAQNLTAQFSIGGTLKYVSQRIHNESANSAAVDVGLLYSSKNESYRIGMSISNFGADMIMEGKDLYRQIDLDESSEGHNETIVAKLKTDYWPLPLFFRVGLSTELIQKENLRLTLSADAFIPSDDTEMVQIGMETALHEMVFLRAGYRALGNADTEEGLTFGAGVRVYTGGMDVNLDYSLQDFGAFGYISQWGIAVGL